jgi:hypothetical protein
MFICKDLNDKQLDLKFNMHTFCGFFSKVCPLIRDVLSNEYNEFSLPSPPARMKQR